MKLPAPSIRKLVRENFSGKTPMIIAPEQRTAMAKSLSDRISRIDGVQMSQHPGDRDSRARALCRFLIPEPQQVGYYYFRHNELRLEVNELRQLVLVTQTNQRDEIVIPVSSLSEIENFVRCVLNRYAKNRAGATKRAKVVELKSNAIVAQVKRIASEDKLEFAIEADRRRVRVFVKMSEHDLIAITIPLKHFDTLVPKLKDHIAMLRSLFHAGLRFQTGSERRMLTELEWMGTSTTNDDCEPLSSH